MQNLNAPTSHKRGTKFSRTGLLADLVSIFIQKFSADFTRNPVLPPGRDAHGIDKRCCAAAGSMDAFDHERFVAGIADAEFMLGDGALFDLFEIKIRLGDDDSSVLRTIWK